MRECEELPSGTSLGLTGGAQETPASKEKKYIFNFRTLAITGHSGSGQSSVGRILSDKLMTEFYDSGAKDFREQQATEIINFQERPIQQDIKADENQKDLIRSATTDKPTVLVAKLAGINVSELPEEESQGVLTIFVTCPNKERFRRVLEREKERGVEGLTLKRVTQETRNREKSDIEQWKKTHPQLEHINPFDPDAKDKNGKRFYKYKVSSYNKTTEEVAEEIMQKLIEDGHITKIANEEATLFPNQGTIFETI